MQFLLQNVLHGIAKFLGTKSMEAQGVGAKCEGAKCI